MRAPFGLTCAIPARSTSATPPRLNARGEPYVASPCLYVARSEGSHACPEIQAVEPRGRPIRHRCDRGRARGDRGRFLHRLFADLRLPHPHACGERRSRDGAVVGAERQQAEPMRRANFSNSKRPPKTLVREPRAAPSAAEKAERLKLPEQEARIAW